MKRPNYIKYTSSQALVRLLAVVLPVVLVITFAITALAYGPERKTYTIEKPADRITFNSITNNPNYGDERNFVIAKDAANTSAGGWSDEIKVKDGKEYIIRMYVHNNAAENLNLTATNTRVKANVPTSYAKSHQIDGFITADNATPKEIWDSVVLKGDKEFIVQFVGGSARYHNNINPNSGFSLSDGIVTSKGVQVGYEKMDGKVPGCFRFSGIATFKVKVVTRKSADFSVTKQVRKQGDDKWHDSINAKIGDKLEYRIGYDNTGKTVQNNVIMRDNVPKGIDYTKGSSSLKNASNPNGNGVAIKNDSLVTDKGVNIGNYTPNSNAFVYYSAKVTKNDLVCGTNKLINRASASTDNGSKSDTAEVVVEVKCKDNECKPGIPEGDERCEDAAAPTMPDELPKTGPAEMIAGVLGVAMVSLGVAYWIRSRQEYRRAIAGHEAVNEPLEGTIAAAAAQKDAEKDEASEPKKDNHADSFHK